MLDISILGIDPSLKASGLALLSPEEGLVIFERIYFTDKMGKGYAGLFERVCEVMCNFKHFMSNYEPEVVASELPLPVGQWSGGLNALDTVMFTDVLKIRSGFYGFNSSYLGFLLQKKKYKHSEYVTLAKDILKSEEFTASYDRFSADEAAAFLFAYRIAIKLGYKPKVDRPKFNIEKESFIKGGREWRGELPRHLQRTEKM